MYLFSPASMHRSHRKTHFRKHVENTFSSNVLKTSCTAVTISQLQRNLRLQSTRFERAAGIFCRRYNTRFGSTDFSRAGPFARVRGAKSCTVNDRGAYYIFSYTVCTVYCARVCGAHTSSNIIGSVQ